MRDNRLRNWWKPWNWSSLTWVVVVLISLLASPFVTRWIILWQIPDVALPFDVEDVVQDNVSDGQNAFVVYSDLLKMPGTPNATISLSNGSNAELSRDEIARRMTGHDAKGLAEYIRAGKMEYARGPSLKTITFSTNLDLHQHLRQLVQNYNSLGISFAESGDIEKAWACHLANLQCSIHAEQPKVAICNLIAIALRNTSAEGIVHWASNPAVSSVRLRAARVDVAREFGRRGRMFDAFKGEYLSARNSLNQLSSMDFLMSGPRAPVSSVPLQVGKKLFLWSTGQPELLLRTYRQILLNNMTELDKPLHLRRPANQPNGIFVHQLDQNARKIPGQLEPEQLVKVIENKSPLYRTNISIIPAMIHYDQARHRDDARFAALMLLFAAHEFQRTHGEFPETLEQLVPAYLDEIPFDPLDSRGAPMKYRRKADGTAIVWSVGGNGANDEGAINRKDDLDIGYLIQVNRTGDQEQRLADEVVNEPAK